jgi:beta-phosphoglucomutase family hydrolase
MIKAIIFHFDGVIINSEPIHEEAWRDFLLKKTITFTEKMRGDFKGRTAIDNLRRILSPTVTEDEIIKMAQEKQVLYRTYAESKLTLVKGVEEFLKKLHQDKQYKIAVATSSIQDNLILAFNKFSIKQYFDTIVTIHNVKKSKPDPEIFLTAAQNLGVSPPDCVVFEDAHSGVIAAKRAGMKVVFVETSFKKSDVEQVNASIQDFSNISIDSMAKMWA